MHPAILALGGAALGVFAYKKLQAAQAASAQAAADQQAAAAKAVSTLDQGKSYTIQAMVTSGVGTRDVPTASALIKAALEQLGWRFLSTPVLRSADAQKAFGAGQPSEWVMNATWTRPDKYMTVAPQWMPTAMFYQLPIS